MRNLARDDKVSILVIDRSNGYRYSAIQGRARMEEAGADQLIEELSWQYTDEAWPKTQNRPRVTVVVSPTRVTDHG